MSSRPTRSRARRNAALAFTLSAAAVLAASGVRGQAARGARAPGADPEINKQFVTPDVKALVGRLETESREVFVLRESIVNSLGLKPGMAVADIGAGTGLFTRLMADRVGPTGTVYAVEVTQPLLTYIDGRSKTLGQAQVKTVLATQDGTGLADHSVDVAFVCDAYHHFENPREELASIRRALRPNGHLVVVDFDRTKAAPKSFVKTHVRADPSVFADEIKAAGFDPLPHRNPPALKENVYLRFRKPADETGRNSGPVGN